jgi:PleD family two-component response regulator
MWGGAAMNDQQGSSSGDARSGPFIIVFSPRERIRDILTVGLSQCNYRISSADTPYLAAIKASQFLPELLIADITASNTKDVLLINRMRKSVRTRHVSILVIIPTRVAATSSPSASRPTRAPRWPSSK